MFKLITKAKDGRRHVSVDYMLVTTSYQPSDDTVELSKQLSDELKCRWVARNKDSLKKLKLIFDENSIWVVSKEEVKYFHDDHPALYFHPSMALIRVKRLIRGEKDTLMECSGMMPGNSVLDCTAGMASDSIVFSYTAGPCSDIVALESQMIPYLLLREGLKRYNSETSLLNEAMRQIQVKYADHLAYLKQLPNSSIDIVYFDPMFRSPIEDSSALSPLRAVANHRSLLKEAIEQAARVARKSVVLKEHRDSEEFDRLGFGQVYKTHSKIAYGVIKL